MKTWLLPVLVLAACQPSRVEETATAPETRPSAAAAEADAAYRQRCVTCHGNLGAGDGMAASALNPRPKDLRDPAWQSGVTDEYIEKIIAGGGPAVGKSMSMPANSDLAPATIQALRAKVRSFRAQ
jgi:mono/diheme cytochrome c family protein